MSTRRQVLRFAVSGVLATASDAAVYAALTHTVLPGQHDPAKACSFVVGTGVAYALARFWTFADAPQRRGQSVGFLALYATAFLVNVGANHAGLGLGLPAPVAFVVATGFSTVLNFVGQKFVLFRAGSSNG
jgi:putative flippase GtrA